MSKHRGVYRVEFDSQVYGVIAEDFAGAVEKWREFERKFQADPSFDDQPESVTRLFYGDEVIE